MKYSTFILIILTFTIISCAKKPQTGYIIPEEKFVSVYGDMVVINDVEKMTKADSAHNRRQIDSVFQSYSVTRDQFQRTVDYYNSDLEQWGGILEKVSKRLEALQALKDSTQKK